MPPPHQPPYPQQPYPHGRQAPGPYGPPGPPQQPYPAQQPYPPQQPYPHQQPYPAQQPYPQQSPHPQQPYPGWGAPPMVPPPKKRRVGMVLGIVGGAVTLAIVALVLVGAAAESGFPAAEHELALPHSLLDAKYTLAEDLSRTEGKKIEEEADGAWDARDIHAAVGRYSPADDSGAVLLVSGMYGRFKNAASVRRSMLKGAAESDGVTVAEPARDLTPSGADTPVRCQVLTQRSAGVTVTYPVCAWADGNTAAVVGAVERDVRDAADVDLDAAARDTLRIRSEMLRPAG
ncbi:hypothetical protein [Streptomyces capoamus]|nr:hypothetical protein [Streptomyces capoamus]